MFRKYKDNERPIAECYDCRLPYEQFPVELVIDHDSWELINPTYNKGAGLLCHSCMFVRLRTVGKLIVDVLFLGINDNQ